jgi:hypothetical protein
MYKRFPMQFDVYVELMSEKPLQLVQTETFGERLKDKLHARGHGDDSQHTSTHDAVVQCSLVFFAYEMHAIARFVHAITCHGKVAASVAMCCSRNTNATRACSANPAG